MKKNDNKIDEDILIQKDKIEIETVSIQNDIFIIEKQKLAGILKRESLIPDSIVQIFNYHF